MTQKRPKRKDSLYSRCFHVVFTKVHESQKSGVPPAAGASRPSIRRGRDARADSRDGLPHQRAAASLREAASAAPRFMGPRRVPTVLSPRTTAVAHLDFPSSTTT